MEELPGAVLVLAVLFTFFLLYLCCRERPPHDPWTESRRTPHRSTQADYSSWSNAEASTFVLVNGIPTLELHYMRVEEAERATMSFLEQIRGRYRTAHIITGRGLHSVGGKPVLKPAIQSLLRRNYYRYGEIYEGGCLEVFL